MRDQPGYICCTGETGTDNPYREAQLALAECRESCQELINTKYSQSDLPDILNIHGGIQVNTGGRGGGAHSLTIMTEEPFIIMNRILSLTLLDSSIISVSQMEDSLHT